MRNLLDKLPDALTARLRSGFARQFIRFALVAIVSLGASELALSIAYLGGATGGIAGLCGWLVGAGVSYVLSRWAWQRKGRPHLLKETLPFWAISIGTAAVSLTSHFASSYAKSQGMPGTRPSSSSPLLTWPRTSCVHHQVLIFHTFPSTTEVSSQGRRLARGRGAVTDSGDGAELGRERAAPLSGATLLAGLRRSRHRCANDPGEVQAVERVVALLAVPDLMLVDRSWTPPPGTRARARRSEARTPGTAAARARRLR